MKKYFTDLYAWCIITKGLYGTFFHQDLSFRKHKHMNISKQLRPCPWGLMCFTPAMASSEVYKKECMCDIYIRNNIFHIITNKTLLSLLLTWVKLVLSKVAIGRSIHPLSRRRLKISCLYIFFRLLCSMSSAGYYFIDFTGVPPTLLDKPIVYRLRLFRFTSSSFG